MRLLLRVVRRMRRWRMQSEQRFFKFTAHKLPRNDRIKERSISIMDFMTTNSLSSIPGLLQYFSRGPVPSAVTCWREMLGINS